MFKLLKKTESGINLRATIRKNQIVRLFEEFEQLPKKVIRL